MDPPVAGKKKFPRVSCRGIMPLPVGVRAISVQCRAAVQLCMFTRPQKSDIFLCDSTAGRSKYPKCRRPHHGPKAAQQIERRSTGLKRTWLRLRVMRAMWKWTARDVVH